MTSHVTHYIQHPPHHSDMSGGTSLVSRVASHVHSHNPFHRVSSHPDDPEEHQKEKDFITDFERNPEPLPPDHISEDPQHKKLGTSSHQLRLDDFELIKTLGTGTFARVWLARLSNCHPQDRDKVVALKILRKVDVIKLKQVEHVRNERNTLAAVAGHPFITTLITSFSDHDCLYMVLEYCPGGEVFSFLRRQRRFDEYTSKFYTAEIVLILEFLHDVEGVAYRDLKPENILLDADGHLKLVDFGFAKKVGKMETYTLCGTPEYLAPEVIRNSGHGTAVDWWALGILLYEFLVGQPPFWDQNPMRIYEQIVSGRIRYPSAMPRGARSLISALCTVNPTERLGFISGGSQRVKEHEFFDGIDWDSLYYRRVRGPIIPRVDHPADAGNFDDYDDPKQPGEKSIYTKEMQKEYEECFKDF